MKSRIAVLVADDHAIVAEALMTSLSRWFRVVGMVTELYRIDDEIRIREPDVVLLDLEFGQTSALKVLPDLVNDFPATRFVILTAFVEPAFADAAVHAGALGYVVKESAASELRVAVEEAFAGRLYLTPALRAAGAGAMQRPGRVADLILTDRQRDILLLLRQGLTHSETAIRLNIATKTVEYHIESLGRRVGVAGTAQLMRWSERFFRDESR